MSQMNRLSATLLGGFRAVEIQARVGHFRIRPLRLAPDDSATVEDLQGVLAADASACATARDALRAISSVRHSSEQDESEYLHNLRVDVHKGDEGSKGYCRCHCDVRRSAGLHRPVAVAVAGRHIRAARHLLR